MRIYKKGDIVDIKVNEMLANSRFHVLAVSRLTDCTIDRAQVPSRRECLTSATMAKRDAFTTSRSTLSASSSTSRSSKYPDGTFLYVFGSITTTDVHV